MQVEGCVLSCNCFQTFMEHVDTIRFLLRLCPNAPMSKQAFVAEHLPTSYNTASDPYPTTPPASPASPGFPRLQTRGPVRTGHRFPQKQGGEVEEPPNERRAGRSEGSSLSPFPVDRTSSIARIRSKRSQIGTYTVLLQPGGLRHGERPTAAVVWPSGGFVWPSSEPPRKHGRISKLLFSPNAFVLTSPHACDRRMNWWIPTSTAHR